MNIELRQERPEDYRETEILTREAFWNHFAPGCDEHYLLHKMRNDSKFVPELDYVALDDGKIVGNIIYVKSMIKEDDGKEHEVLCIGPVSVLPEYQNKGIGGKMIEYTKNLAREMGYRAVLLYGDPDYYSHHGFIPGKNLGIRTSDNMYAAALQVCELYQDALSGINGRFIEGSIYEVDESEAIAFDKDFPEKEKVSGTPSQQKFKKMVGMRESAD